VWRENARSSLELFHSPQRGAKIGHEPKSHARPAGGLFLAGITAIQALRAVHVSAGDTIVISAAAGGVGSMEAQLAKLSGATVIGTCGERNFDYLRQVGIKPVVYGEGMADRIRDLAPGGVSAYIDNFGDNNAELAAELGVPVPRFSSSESRRSR
jgi:NADPH:quinone reductase